MSTIEFEVKRDPSSTLPKYVRCTCGTDGLLFKNGSNLVHTLTWNAVFSVDGSLKDGSEIIIIQTVHADGEKARKSYLFSCPAGGLKEFLKTISMYKPNIEAERSSEHVMKEKADYQRNKDILHYWWLGKGAIYIAAFCALAGLLYCNQFQEEWTTIDFVYFAFATMLTVGYGDLKPTTRDSRVFTIFFVLAGTGIVVIFVRGLVSWLLSYHEEKAYQIAKKIAFRTEIRETVTGQHIEVEHSRLPGGQNREHMVYQCHQWRLRMGTYANLLCCPLDCVYAFFIGFWPVIWALLQIALLLLAGCVIGHIEGWSFEQSLYFSAVTVTSVGYGDFAPETQGGRLLCVFYMPIGVYLAVNALGQIVMFTILKQLRSEKSATEIMMELDLNNDDRVSLEEFQLHMMKKLGRVDDRLLNMLELQYNKFNQTGKGFTGKRFHEAQKGREEREKEGAKVLGMDINLKASGSALVKKVKNPLKSISKTKENKKLVL
jgi:hypothetical protein